ncbi:DHA1 family inner membrane transport protein [Rhodoferax ferrireducens]|uniref:DHA1 family inner membrane transport protein n=1 Tax=Rhodoferax ferrireducens TaxID=192843 RepID=A0ABU2C7V0_9BURK|nr:MFS transporter [Rhodoferax ferrireducens]MDR7377412.1 DHA1 family inner membrane transport protein [Rhodoferax ferrireducens]
MNLPLLALAIAAFGIGTTEFVIMGLLPEVAGDLGVSIPSAGMLVSAYALGVAVGGPILAVATARLPRKTTLAWLMALFVLGNVGCALAPDYGWLMVARVLTSFCHAAFFGIGAVVATSVVEPHKRAQAMSLMFAGLTLANVLGVPLGTLLGQQAGWRSTFWVVAVIGVLAMLAVLRWVPALRQNLSGSVLGEFRVLKVKQVWLALGTSALASAALFTVFTYITPILRDVTGVAPQNVSGVLLLCGVGLTIGNLVGGRLADWKLMPSLMGIFAAVATVLVVFSFTSAWLWPAVITLMLWGMASFATGAPLQVRVVSQAGTAPGLASTLNIGAFNLGNAAGAWLGGAAIDIGWSLQALPLVAAGVAVLALGVTAYSAWLERRGPQLRGAVLGCETG